MGRQFDKLWKKKWEPADSPTGSLFKKAAAPRARGRTLRGKVTLGDASAARGILCVSGGRRHRAWFPVSLRKAAESTEKRGFHD